jgi:hypothetical protein
MENLICLHEFGTKPVGFSHSLPALAFQGNTMSDFDLSNEKETADAEDEINSSEKATDEVENVAEVVETSVQEAATAPTMIDASKPVIVTYCPFCSLPCEYCKFGNIYESKCLPWIQENCPAILEANLLAESMSAATIADGEDNVKYWHICLFGRNLYGSLLLRRRRK